MKEKNDDVNFNWQPIYLSFMTRSEKCPRQKWHCDYKNGYFVVFPMYPYGTNPNWFSQDEGDNDLHYDVYVI